MIYKSFSVINAPLNPTPYLNTNDIFLSWLEGNDVSYIVDENHIAT